MRILLTALVALFVMGGDAAWSQTTAGKPGKRDLVIVQDGASQATIVVAPDAGKMEALAAEELQKYVEMMSGAKLAIASNAAAIDEALKGKNPVLIIGSEAIKADSSLQKALNGAVKKNPILNADAIVLRHHDNRVFLAGNNDQSHYSAVSQLLQHWGCRWYMPTDFGECIPESKTLTVGDLDQAYGSPFEIRGYWLSWNGDGTGAAEFQRRNFIGSAHVAGGGHALGQYTKNLVPPGKSIFQVPLSEEATAIEVAARIESEYAKGVPGISLAIEDGNYTSDSASDKELQAGIYDKYLMGPANTDGVITLYNNVAKILRAKYPASPTKLGGLAYVNVTLPPQRITNIEPNVVMWIAPIDIDPNHGMDDPNSPPRREYKAMMYRWANLLHGQLAVYDYDQGQLVWRDLPNPSHQAFAQDVKHYRKAGILGIATESRGAIATTFLNLFFRLQLMWNPDADVDAMLVEFYPKFYGPATAPMADYWNAIFAAWKNTLSTEHEFMNASSIYTPELLNTLRAKLAEAQKLVEPLRGKANLTRNEKLYLDRMQFTDLSFQVIDGYMAMTRAAGNDVDYKAAAAAGDRALAARDKLTDMNPTFTTYRRIGEHGPAWFPGEVQLMKDIATFTDGSNGTLIAKTPLEWAFHRDPHDAGLAGGWAYAVPDLTYWNAKGKSMSSADRKDYPSEWEMVRSDIYLQGQGIRHPDYQSFTGHYWYQTEMNLKADQVAGKTHIRFPGLFNECWLYVNGALVAHRVFGEPWWATDYTFQWDVDLTGKLQPGKNTISLRGKNPHHFGGMFRRPFLYRATQ